MQNATSSVCHIWLQLAEHGATTSYLWAAHLAALASSVALVDERVDK